MGVDIFDKLKNLINNSKEVTEVLEWTKKSLSLLEKETWINFFKRTWDWLKKFFWIKENNPSWNTVFETQTNANIERNSESEEILSEWWGKISNDMFQELLKMEWNQDFTARIHRQSFGEDFPTWPYGMVYKHIDSQWNLLKNPIPFKDWERLTKDWSEKNAKAYYDKRAKDWTSLLDKNWYRYTQNNLDALVSASWWTTASVKRLKNFVTQHRDNKQDITRFLSTFATTSAWNWKIQPWLVSRRKFESNRFQWIKHPYSDYQKGRYA